MTNHSISRKGGPSTGAVSPKRTLAAVATLPLTALGLLSAWRNRRKLGELSDRQLRDAGLIEPHRGPAADATIDPNLEGLR